jgi:S-adenosylmethionine-diacylgycerolhomoserine-N-methlytransferase
MMDAEAELEHRRFLNAFYGIGRHFYDASRRFVLVGRDATLRDLAKESWTNLVEVGPGTGRNLIALHRSRSDAKLFGVEASDAMLEYARAKCPFATIEQGFAERHDFEGLVGARPDRVLFSYSLSMVQRPDLALDNARRALAPGGEIVIVDFGECQGMPEMVRRGLSMWLSSFHVKPVGRGALEALGARVRTKLGGYVLCARIKN